MAFDPEAAAAHIAAAHAARTDFTNLAGALAPPGLDEAYAAQEALHRLWSPRKGAIAGLKIATTTPVMQRLVGIDHPCCGAIFASEMRASGARLRLDDHVSLKIECEIALRLGADLTDAAPIDRERARAAVSAVMPAFELVEDRNADYKKLAAASLIADNCWNAGIVAGAPVAAADAGDLVGRMGRLERNGAPIGEGGADDPVDALAWVARLAAGRGRPLRAGMVVMTGSLIATLSLAPASSYAFSVDGLGTVELSTA